MTSKNKAQDFRVFFDFTELKNPLADKTTSAIVGWAGNDGAVISQKLGAITSVEVEILFNGVWGEDVFIK